MKIAILGGRFDPPHLGHLRIAREVLRHSPDIDRVIFIPVFEHHWSTIVGPKHRINMVKSLLGPKMEVSDIEIERKGKSYTIDTLKSLKKQINADIYWIVGSDVLPKFNLWKNSKDLTKLATFLVFPRPGHPIPKELPEGFEKIDSPSSSMSDVSSTKIREMIKKGESIKNLVPEKVEEYIKDHKLYGK